MAKKFLLNRLATFGAVTILSGLLLLIFPYYPPYITIILALALGAIGLEFPNIGLILAILLSVFGAMYQDALAGITVLVVFIIALALTVSWLDMACVVASWILAFLTPVPSLAIAPTLFAGVHGKREEAVKVGVISGFSIFLLSWTRNMMQGRPNVSFNHRAAMLRKQFQTLGGLQRSYRALTLSVRLDDKLLHASSFKPRRLSHIHPDCHMGYRRLPDSLPRVKNEGKQVLCISISRSPTSSNRFHRLSTDPCIGHRGALVAAIIIPPAYKFLEPAIVEKLRQQRKLAAIMFTDIVGIYCDNSGE